LAPHRSHIIPCFLLLFLLSCGNGPVSQKKDPLPTLTETYNREDNNPFGGSVAFKAVKEAFDEAYINTVRHPFKNFWLENSTEKALYISISKMQFIAQEDVEYMLRYASNGNELFLVSRQFDTTLLKAAGVEEDNGGDFYHPFYAFRSLTEMDDHTISLARPYFSDTLLYDYFYYPFQRHFTLSTRSPAKVLGHNSYGEPNCIVFFYGKGKIFLHCDPRAFSNYYLLKERNIKNLTSLVGYCRSNPASIYWDDYYGKQNYRSDRQSGLGYLLSQPPLRWAFWLSLFLLLLYVLFGGKRKQRIVPVRKPNRNYSVNFAETIGRLYLQKKDNRNIADKMILYFNEFIRNKYYLNTNHINDEFLSTLSRKSGVDQGQVEKLYRAILHAQNNYDIDDYKLLSLNQQIQTFYKKI
jgi:hypothetical protein